MAERPNPAQIAPGDEAADIPFNTPYVGWEPNDHIGYSLNESFWLGAQPGRQ